MNRIFTPTLVNPQQNVFFGFEQFEAGTVSPVHQHEWGQLQYVQGGVMELTSAGQHFIAPSQFAIWVPAHVEHESLMRRSLHYSSINILSGTVAMPNNICLLKISQIACSIVDDFRQRQLSYAHTDADKRLIQVLLDQLQQAPQQQDFLPMTDDRLLAPILAELEQDPVNQDSISTWAQRVHTTERTLARHCLTHLGMSLSEWRARRKYIYSLHLLRQGISIKEVALSLGYHQTSPFIILFKKYAACTPHQYQQRSTLPSESN